MTKHKRHSGEYGRLVTALWLVAVLSGPVHGIFMEHHSRLPAKAKTAIAVFDHCMLCHFQAGGVLPEMPWASPEWKIPELRWLVYTITSPAPRIESGVFLRGPPRPIP